MDTRSARSGKAAFDFPTPTGSIASPRTSVTVISGGGRRTSIGGGSVKVESAGSATSPRAALIDGSVQILLEPARAALFALGAAMLAVSLLTLPAANIFSNLCGIGLGSLLLHNFRAVKPTAAAAADSSFPASSGGSARGLTELITKPPAKRRSGCCSPKDVTGLAVATAVFAAGEMVAIGLAWWQLESIRPSLLLPLMAATEPVYSSWLEALLWRWLASALAMGAGSAFVHIVLAGVVCTAMSALVKSADTHVQANAHAARTQELLRAAGVAIPMDDPRLLTGDPRAAAVGAPVPVLRSVSKRGLRSAETPQASVSAHAAALRRIGSSGGRSASMSMREAALRGSVATEPGLSSYERESLAMAGSTGNGNGNGSFRMASSQPPRSSPLTSPTASFPGRLHTIHESGATSGGGGDTSRDHYGPPDASGGMGVGSGSGRATVTASSTAAAGDRDWDRDGGHSNRSSNTASSHMQPQLSPHLFVPPLQMQQMRGAPQPQSQSQPQPQPQVGAQGSASMSEVRSALQRIGSMRMAAAPATSSVPQTPQGHAQQQTVVFYEDALAGSGSAQSAPDAAVEAVLQSAVHKLAASMGMGFSEVHGPLMQAQGLAIPGPQVADGSYPLGGGSAGGGGGGGAAASAAAVYRAPSLADLVHAVRAERAAGRL